MSLSKSSLGVSVGLVSLATTIGMMAIPSWALAAVCTTIGMGQPYSYDNADSSLARKKAFDYCFSAANTTREECTRNMVCDDDYRPQISCTARSLNERFTYSSPDSSFARGQATSLCNAFRGTDPEECRINTICSDEGYVPITGCSTRSDGQEFLYESRDPSFASRKLFNVCVQASGTTREQCSRNLGCHLTSGGGSPASIRSGVAVEPHRVGHSIAVTVVGAERARRNDIRCAITTKFGMYPGYGYDTNSANREAYDLCIHRESSYQCSGGSYTCPR